ncbi:MAG: hypothetical protein ABI672_16235, partial [Vicinamibacteria bacterium]
MNLMKLSDFSRVLAAVLLAGAGGVASAQTAAPQASPTPTATPSTSIVFPSAVELVTVDAVVTDKKNIPIENLTQ